MHNFHKEEMDIYGATFLGPVLNGKLVETYREDLLQRTQEDVEQFGKETLIEKGLYETVWDLPRFGGIYFDLLENDKINPFINTVLNDKAVVFSYNGIINKCDARSGMVGFNFHRDQPPFKDTRTAVIVMIPLVDYSPENGSTEYVPGTHLFLNRPSVEFMEKHCRASRGRAGEAIAVDAATLHRAGRNNTNQHRPMITIKFVLAPFKQQIDYCNGTHPTHSAPEIVKQRLGWNARVPSNREEVWLPAEEKKFKSGQYDMSNTSMHDCAHWVSAERG